LLLTHYSAEAHLANHPAALQCCSVSQRLPHLRHCLPALQVTEVFMAAYSSLGSPQQQLTFFTLLAREFGVQGMQHIIELNLLKL
jgi:hypothetical protein